MPRLTDTAFLQTYQELHSAWLSDPASFALLSASVQWDLYGYFALEHTLSVERLLAYRAEVTRVDPSLAQRAGRGVTLWRAQVRQLELYRARPQVPATGKHRKRKDQIRIFAAVQPEINADKLVRALFAAFADHQAATSKPKPGRKP